MKPNHQELLEKCRAVASKLQGTFEYDADHDGFGGTFASIAPYPILVSTAKTGETVSIEDNRLIFYANLRMNFSYRDKDFQLFAGDCISRREYDQVKKEISVAASRPVEQIAHEILSRLMRPLINIWPQMEKVRDERLAYYQNMDVTAQEFANKLNAVGITTNDLDKDWVRDQYYRSFYCQDLGQSLRVTDTWVSIDLQNLSLSPNAATAIIQIILQDKQEKEARRQASTATAAAA